MGSSSACAFYLSKQALVVPHLSVQSYSVPMVLLNSSPPPVEGDYDRIKPSFGREPSKRVSKDSRFYFRNVDTGDTQIQENGRVLGEGPLVYVPIEDLQVSNQKPKADASFLSSNTTASTDASPKVDNTVKPVPSASVPMVNNLILLNPIEIDFPRPISYPLSDSSFGLALTG